MKIRDDAHLIFERLERRWENDHWKTRWCSSDDWKTRRKIRDDHWKTRRKMRGGRCCRSPPVVSGVQPLTDAQKKRANALLILIVFFLVIVFLFVIVFLILFLILFYSLLLLHAFVWHFSTVCFWISAQNKLANAPFFIILFLVPLLLFFSHLFGSAFSNVSSE